jgi:sulfide:quinone oxidoreductase
MYRVLILGGGFGGIAAAHTLRQSLPPEDEIILVERRTHFMMGLHKNWVLTGQSTLEAGQRPLSALSKFGITVRQGTITAIHPAERAAEIDGERIEADALIVALGAQLAPEAVPGFADHALNVYDPASIEGAAKAVDAMQGGRLVIGVFGAPYKCPPAPYEMALLLKDMFARNQVDVALEVFTLQPMSLPVLGEAGCSVLDTRLEENGIIFLASHKATAVEPGQVVFGDRARPYDLLLGVPPHRCPDVVKQSGLTGDAPWVRVDPRTMQTSFSGVYAVGDTTEIILADGKPLPKAGVFAEAEGIIAARNIAATLTGKQPDAEFDGVGYCFMEVGRGEAVLVTGKFLAQPAPEVVMTEPSTAHMQAKHAFEADHLKAWFGD